MVRCWTCTGADTGATFPLLVWTHPSRCKEPVERAHRSKSRPQMVSRINWKGSSCQNGFHQGPPSCFLPQWAFLLWVPHNGVMSCIYSTAETKPKSNTSQASTSKVSQHDTHMVQHTQNWEWHLASFAISAAFLWCLSGCRVNESSPNEIEIKFESCIFLLPVLDPLVQGVPEKLELGKEAVKQVKHNWIRDHLLFFQLNFMQFWLGINYHSCHVVV